MCIFNRSSFAMKRSFPTGSAVGDFVQNETDEHFMSIARQEANKSMCVRRRVGAILVKNGKVVSKGCNGVPSGLIDCSSEATCFKVANGIESGAEVDEKNCRVLHAEQFAIVNALKKRNREPLVGATLYCTEHPCSKCALLIVVADVHKVIYENDYPDSFAKEFLRRAGVTVRQHNGHLTMKG